MALSCVKKGFFSLLTVNAPCIDHLIHLLPAIISLTKAISKCINTLIHCINNLIHLPGAIVQGINILIHCINALIHLPGAIVQCINILIHCINPLIHRTRTIVQCINSLIHRTNAHIFCIGGVIDPKAAVIFRHPAVSSFSASEFFLSGRICGKRITSRIECLLVSSMTRRSTPRPMPAAGGMP